MSKNEAAKKLKTKSELKKELWKWFSQYIRLRDADDRGYVNCISCGEAKNWKYEIDAGHYIPQIPIYEAIRFHEWNVNGQCKSCNGFKEGNTAYYRKNLIDKIGKDAVEWLEEHAGDGLNWKIYDYKEKIEYYKNQVKELKKIKGLE